MRRQFLTIGASFALLVPGLQAQVTTFSTFGPGDSYVDGAGWTIGIGTAGQSVAGGFTYAGPSGALLFDFSVATFVNEGPVLFEFMAGSVNGGTLLESWNLPGGGPEGISTITSVLQPVLQQGESYWLRMIPTAGSTFWAWNLNDAGYLGLYAVSGGGDFEFSDTDESPAFAIRVDTPGEVVPEPASMSLLATGLAGLAAARRRRRA